MLENQTVVIIQFIITILINYIIGIIDTRVDDVLNAIQDTFEVTEKLLENGWCCLVAKLKK